MVAWTNTRILGACGLTAAALGALGGSFGGLAPYLGMGADAAKVAGFVLLGLANLVMLAANLVLLFRRERAAPARREDELLELAWGVIANAGGGNWTLETPEWQEAAARWRDLWHAHLREQRAASSPPTPQQSLRPGGA